MKLDSLIDQFVSSINTEENQRKLKSAVIDPLVLYFQQKLKLFYLVITVLLTLIVILNVGILYQLIVRSWLVK